VLSQMRCPALANGGDVGVELGECRISESILVSKRSPRCVREGRLGHVSRAVLARPLAPWVGSFQGQEAVRGGQV
jgi:hypothetical protein